jgi:hypothetical protein
MGRDTKRRIATAFAAAFCAGVASTGSVAAAAASCGILGVETAGVPLRKSVACLLLFAASGTAILLRRVQR